MHLWYTGTPNITNSSFCLGITVKEDIIAPRTCRSVSFIAFVSSNILVSDTEIIRSGKLVDDFCKMHMSAGQGLPSEPGSTQTGTLASNVDLRSSDFLNFSVAKIP